MICFPSCKINLGLSITQKRADGFHALETVFYPITLTDVLEIIIEPETSAAPITFTSSGLAINGDPTDNLCYKAYFILKMIILASLTLKCICIKKFQWVQDLEADLRMALLHL